MTAISRESARKMVDEKAATVVDVLGPDAFADYHLPDAVNVPVKDNFEEKIQKVVPDKASPVILYCMDENCDASPKAAEKMEKLGYERVYDYEAGKKDWKDAGLPVVEGAV